MRGLKNVDIAQQNESYIDDAENVAAAMSGLIGYKAPDDGLQVKMVVLGSESGAQQQNESYIDDAVRVAPAMSELIGYKAPDDGLQGKMVVLGSESGAQQQKAESYVDKLKPKEKVKEGSCWCR